MRTLEKSVIQDTLKRCKNEYAEDTARLIKDTQFYNTEISDDVIRKKIGDTKKANKITVINTGTVTAGRDIAKATGKRTAILNFADAIRPGGWVLDGAPTQEENLCRCSNLYPALLGEDAFKNYYYVNSVYVYPKDESELYGADIEVPKGVTWENLNPIHALYTHRLMYFKDVKFFKDDTTYELEDAYNLDVITCPAPAVEWRSETTEHYIIYERAKQIIKSAILNDVDNIVLGAWGCGAFGQRPEVVATAFMKAIKRYKAFDNVIFAVRRTADYWKDYNYPVFEEICK